MPLGDKMSALRASALAACLLTAAFGATGLVEARGLGELAAPLPSPRNAVSTVSTGDAIYVFGGYASGFSDQILRFDPRANTMEVLAAKLPTGRIWTSAAWTGSHAFIFGGVTDWGVDTDQILRFDPATEAVTVMAAKLPSARSYTNAVWDGSFVWIFGGNTGLNAHLDEILRYDPAADTIEVAARLPYATDYMSAVWTGSEVYLFGGSKGLGNVIKYVPGDARATLTLATFLVPIAGTSAAWDGQAAYIFGGFPIGTWHGAPSTPTVWKFRPDLGLLVLLHDVLPAPRANTAAVWHGDHAYILGGSTVALATSLLADNVRYTPGFEGVLQMPELLEWITGDLGLLPGFSEPEKVLTEVLEAPGSFVRDGDGWRWDTRTAPDGRHTLRLRTTGAAGEADLDEAVVGVDNLPPVAAMTQPAAGEVWLGGLRLVQGSGLSAVAVGALRVAADASDAGSGVAGASLLVDGKVRATTSAPPYAFTWKAQDEAAGAHLVQVRVWDRVGHVTVTDGVEVVTIPSSMTGLAATLDR